MKDELKSINWKDQLYDRWVLLVLVGLFTIFSMLSPVFMSVGNMSNLLRSVPTLGIVTLGLTMVIITGGVDLSCGSIVAFAGTTSAYCASQGWNPIICIISGVVVGGLCGYLNAFLITQFKLQPFIVTLGTNYFIRGLILFLTNGIFINGMPDWFYNLSNTHIAFKMIYSNTIFFIILAFIVAYVMKNTRFGRYCYIVGSNKEAARLSGINVTRHFRKVYIVEGMLAGVAGILLMSNLNVGAPSEAVGLEAFAIAAAIIGGTQFGGGIGTIGGAVAGLFTIEVFKNGLAVLGINSYGQQAVTGIVIIIAVVIDYYRKESLFKVKSNQALKIGKGKQSENTK